MTAATTLGEVVSESTAAARRLGPLTRRSDAKGVAQLAGHAGALAVTGGCVAASIGTAWFALALLAHGFVLIFLFAPLHETIHRSAFRSGWLNTAVAWTCGALLVLPPAYFRAFHFAHHRWTQDPASDPELAVPKPTTWRGYLWTVSGIPYWRERIGTTIRHAAGKVDEPFISASMRGRVVRDARILLGAYGAVAAGALVTGSAAPLYLWVLPALLGQPFLRMFLLAEHAGCPLVSDMHANSRTTLTNAVMRRLGWNMSFHTAHHVYPGVPFHALPEVHARIRDRVAVVAPGYVAVQREVCRGFGGPP